MPKAPENLSDFKSLIKVVEALRGPEGCPWDKEQTHASLTRYAIEEAHELAEAIESGDLPAVQEELGDVLLQVVLHAEIARQSGEFEVSDVIRVLNEKMIRRHPHVFGNVRADSSDQVLRNWAQIKAEEKADRPDRPLSFDIPAGLPALLRAQKIGEKTTRVGFDWTGAEPCWLKVEEEMGELRRALDTGDKAEIESELGDVLFSLAQLARHLNLDGEQALRRCNSRFEDRFRFMQELADRDGKIWSETSADEKEKYWRAAKASFRDRG